jgi:hypothetical protein
MAIAATFTMTSSRATCCAARDAAYWSDFGSAAEMDSSGRVAVAGFARPERSAATFAQIANTAAETPSVLVITPQANARAGSGRDAGRAGPDGTARVGDVVAEAARRHWIDPRRRARYVRRRLPTVEHRLAGRREAASERQGIVSSSNVGRESLRGRVPPPECGQERLRRSPVPCAAS